MKPLPYLGKSIGLTQAAAVLLASLVIGLVLSALQLGYTLSSQRRDATELAQEILTLAEGGATRAAWTLDPGLAGEVVNSVMALGGVQFVALLDEDGSVLARAEKQNDVRSWFVSWFAAMFIGDQIQGRRELSVAVGGGPRKVGELSVGLASTQVAEDFISIATTVLIAGLVQAFSIGLVLLWLSSWLVTSPLRRVATAIADIDPKRPDAITLPTFPAHEGNELGHLLRHTNRMLERLASSQEQLRNLATRDPLTDLSNRTLITETLTHAILRAQRNDNLVAVLFLDLDRFKNINDSLGHEVGDDLLVAVAHRMTETLRSNDSIGRLGGDEFLIVLEDVRDVDEIIRTVQRVTDALSQPFVLRDHEVRTAGSAGIAVFPNDGEDASVLMRHADLAMYDAKGGGGARWHFFTEELSERVESRLNTEVALARALDRDELFLVFQPKVEACSRDLVGCEALLRWNRDGESIAAGHFIEIAEDTGMIVKIGDWVLEQACHQICDWTRRFGPTPIAVNVSARQLHDPEFVSRVLAVVERYEIDPRLIELEITETVVIEGLDQNASLLSRLREAGITLSIDDFGTGYSSLSYLTRLPVDTLKIDRSFVSGPQRSDAVLEMIVAMAKALQLKTVAEGVETEEQCNSIIAKGYDVLQGYCICEPISAAAFEEKFLAGRPMAISRSEHV